MSVGADVESGGTSTSGRSAEDVAPSPVWAALVNFERVGKKDKSDGGDGESHKKKKEGPYIVDVLLNCSSDTIPGTSPKRSAVDIRFWAAALEAFVMITEMRKLAFSFLLFLLKLGATYNLCSMR